MVDLSKKVRDRYIVFGEANTHHKFILKRCEAAASSLIKAGLELGKEAVLEILLCVVLPVI